MQQRLYEANKSLAKIVIEPPVSLHQELNFGRPGVLLNVVSRLLVMRFLKLGVL